MAAVCAVALPAWAQSPTDTQPQPQSQPQYQQPSPSAGANADPSLGPVRLIGVGASPRDAADPRSDPRLQTPWPQPPRPYVQSEFERYVQQQATQVDDLPPEELPPEALIMRFGSQLMLDGTQLASEPSQVLVPDDYIIQPGDVVQLTAWGSVDASLSLTVDRSGRIAVPRVGAVPVAGVRYGDLTSVIQRQMAQQFRNFQVSATLGQLRAVRVFVAGFVQRPGALSVSSLASVLHVLIQAGGPTAAGSYRDITVRRQGKVVTRIDLYDLLVKGDRAADRLVQADDVVFVGPVGKQVGVVGSVAQQAVFELREGEVLADVLRMAGGFSPVADQSRVSVDRVADRGAKRISEWPLPQAERSVLASGDVVRVFSAVAARLPKERQNKRVRVEGEVARPGDYLLPPGSGIADALAMAGGLTPSAFVFGTEFARESVRTTQQTNYDRALRDLELDLTATQASQRATTAEEVASQNAGMAVTQRLVERLKLVRPTGRLVLQLSPDATELPNMPLEDGDRLSVPSRATSVGVFGSVFNAGSFVYEQDRKVQDYLTLAGGPKRGADEDSVFVVRANGSVVSARQGGSWWGGSNAFSSAQALPGDTVFVPEEMNKTTLTQDFKDWTQILYQFGLGLAGIKALGL